MTTRHAARFLATLCAVAMAGMALSPLAAAGQDKPKVKKDSSKATGATDSSTASVITTKVPKLFSRVTPLQLTLAMNLKQLRKERSETSPYHAATLAYVDADSTPVAVPVRVKTHGIWRLKHCELPPLRLNFSNKAVKGTIFHDVEKPKVVSPCKRNADYEQYVLQEYQLYRIYQLLTPASHRARLVHMTYVDSATGKAEPPVYAFIFEDPEQMAARLGGQIIKTKGAGPDDLKPAQSAIAFLFEYMIGNTDFSFWGQHNGEIVTFANGDNLPVAYDFDFSGAVNAPYATVDPQLSIKRVRDRLYRGYCAHNAMLPGAIAVFQQQKAAIYALYGDEIGKLINARTVHETLRYFDDFYSDISRPKELQSACVRAN
jgi:hypothetical protein